MTFEQVRSFALSLPEATEQPHFDLTSFRVRGKIFATAPPGETHLHVFTDETTTDAWIAQDPAAFEPLMWGSKRRGVRVNLASARPDLVTEMVEESWRRKAPASLRAELDRRPDSR